MRLIDADALLMNMNLAIAILEGTMKNLGLQDDAECQMELKAYRDIRDGIKDEPTAEPTAQPEPHWIPCSERLPEKAGAYLTQALMNDDIFVSIWEGRYWNVKTPIIAWMPLPAKYKGDDTERTISDLCRNWDDLLANCKGDGTE